MTIPECLQRSFTIRRSTADRPVHRAPPWTAALLLGVLLVAHAPEARAQAGRTPPGRTPAGPQDGGVVVAPTALDNGLLRLDFQANGTNLELTTLTNLSLDGPGGRPMSMAAGSGAWAVNLVMKGGFFANSSPVNQWFTFDMAGATNWNTNVWPGGSPPFTLNLALDSISENEGGLPLPNFVARWSGDITLTAGGGTYPFEIVTDWALVPGRPFAETGITIDFNPDDLGTAPDLPFYTSYIVYPSVHVDSLQSPSTPDDALVVPWQIGSLITNPTSGEVVNQQKLFPFPKFLGFGANLFPIRVAGYYDGAPQSNCFFFAANDCDAYWKELWLNTGPNLPLNNCEAIAAATPIDTGTLANGAVQPGARGEADGPDGSGRYVTFRFQHFRDDVYSSSKWTMPYRVRLGAIEGDWWDLAQTYRELMLEKSVPWYQGPVGAATNDMPAAGKQLVGEVLLQPRHHGDQVDLLTRQTLDVARVMGPHVNTIWYATHSPDRFSYWYFGDGTPGNTGFLPGRPSLASAVREAQKQFGQIVSPYYQSSHAVDCLDPLYDGDCFDDLNNVQSALLLREDLAPFVVPTAAGPQPPRRASMCAGSSWWRTEMPTRTAEIAAFTGMRGIYLDFFLPAICYSDQHPHAPPGEPLGAPGGGDWMYRTRMRQVRDMQDALPAELTVGMEYTIGRFAEEVDLMHLDPTNNLMWAELYNFIECDAPPVARPMGNAVTIPFFKAVFDNVKLGTIETTSPDQPDRRAWSMATLVFTFGTIPGVTRGFLEELPVFSQRTQYGGFYRFLGDVAAVLRDGGFLTWHNGTLRRLPGYSVGGNAFTASPGTALPGVEVYPFLDCASVDAVDVVATADPVASFSNSVQRRTPVYTEERVGCNDFTPETFLTPGMFQAPDDAIDTTVSGQGTWTDAGSLAFILANPWMDPFNNATLDVGNIDFAPSRYPGWSDSSVYCVYEYRMGATPAAVIESHSGPLSFAPTNSAMPPGDIAWWVFRKEAGAE